MKGTAAHLLEFLEGSRKRFVIPVYQRNYDWKLENCRQLFDDLVNVILNEKQSHFFGSIVSCAHGRDEVILIDGQQRITTVSLILIAMVNALKKSEIESNDPNLREIIEDTYIIDKYRRDERKVRLKPFRDDCMAFDSLIFNEESDYIADSTVTVNYRYFYDRIVNECILTADQLFAAIDSLVIIDIELEPEHGDDPQLIFESLNSTGLNLSEADKIRNFILMGLQPEIQEKFYDTYWNKIETLCGSELDGFVRNYLTIETGVIPNISSIYTAFKKYADSVTNIETILVDMLKYAQAYHGIIVADVGTSLANTITRRLNLLDITVAHPFLMAFLNYAKETELDAKEVEQTLSVIETFLFRRFVCGFPTNALNKIFASLHKNVVKIKRNNDSYSSVMIYILQNRKQSIVFPRDDEFIQEFTTRNIYSLKSKFKEYIFERLENGSSRERNDVAGNIEDGILSVEHIMPQTLNAAWRQELGENADEIQEKWLHTIANLTLTGYNSTYSNRTFAEKKKIENGFAQSGLRLNQYIATFDKWTETELEARKNRISEMALKIWKYPATDFVPEQKEDETVSLSEDNDISTGRKISFFEFRGTRTDVNDWADMMFKVVDVLYSTDPLILYHESSNSKNPWFETNATSARSRKLADHLYFCPQNSSTSSKMAMLKKWFALYRIDEDDLLFGLVSSKECVAQETTGRTENASHCWLVPSNENQFRLNDWLKAHDFVYWRQNVNYHVGDIVYIYGAAPTSAIIGVFEVESINNKTYPEFEEEASYYVSHTQINAKFYSRLRLIALTDRQDKLSLTKLKENGLKSAPQGSLVLKGEILDYISSVF